jgi:hypothetical protein
MKKIFGLGILMGLVFGVNTVLFAQEGQNPPPQDGQRKMRRQDGQDGQRRMMRGKRGGGRGERGMRRGGMRGGGFGISDQELFKLNLTNDQKVKLFDFRKKMATERESMMKDREPGEGMKPMMEGMNPAEMRQLMSAKQLGTLTAEQKAKLDSIEANRKQMMEKRKTEMEARKAKMEATHQEFLNIFTLDQRKQLETMRAERAKQIQEKMQQRRGPGGPGGPKGQKPPTPPVKPNE